MANTEETYSQQLSFARNNDRKNDPEAEISGEDPSAENAVKITPVEILYLNMYIIPLDVICLILVFFGLDDFWIMDLLTFPVTQFYFRMKGAKAGVDLAASLLELVPYLGALPIKSVGLNIAIYLTNHPEKIKKISLKK